MDDTARLSERQRQVLTRLRSGLTNKIIASQLGIGEQAVKAHVSRSLAHYNVESRMALLIRLNESQASVHPSLRDPAAPTQAYEQTKVPDLPDALPDQDRRLARAEALTADIKGCLELLAALRADASSSPVAVDRSRELTDALKETLLLLELATEIRGAEDALASLLLPRLAAAHVTALELLELLGPETPRRSPRGPAVTARRSPTAS